MNTKYIVMAALMIASLSDALAEDLIPLSRNGLENIYICAAVARSLNDEDAAAQETVIRAFESALPEVAAVSAELRSAAKQRIENMQSQAELRAFDDKFCKRATVIK